MDSGGLFFNKKIESQIKTNDLPKDLQVEERRALFMEENHSYHVFLVWAALTASEKTGRTSRESIGGESRSFAVHGTVSSSISFRARVRPDKTRGKRKGGCGIHLLFPHGSGN